MKKLLFVSSIISVAAVGSAQTIYQADFETPTYHLGSIIGQQGWDSTAVFDVGSQPGSGAVKAGVGRNGSNGLSTGYGHGYEFLNVSVGGQWRSATYKIGMYAYVPVGYGENHNVTGAGFANVAFQAGNKQQATVGLRLNEEYGRNLYTLTSIHDNASRLDSLSFEGKWTRLEMLVDTVNQSTSYFVDGALVGTRVSEFKNLDVTSINIQLATVHYDFEHQNYDGRVIYDDLTIEAAPAAVPEPASMAILASGALGIFLRKRQQK